MVNTSQAAPPPGFQHQYAELDDVRLHYVIGGGPPGIASHLAVVEGMPFGPSVFEAPSWKTAPGAQKGCFVGFHQIPELPELLTQGHEREYLTYFYRQFSSAPGSFSNEEVNEFLRTYSDPKSMHAGFELYRAIPQDIENNQKLAEQKLTMPVLASGGELCYSNVIREIMEKLATDVSGGIVAGANHWIPEEQPDKLMAHLKELLVNRTQYE